VQVLALENATDVIPHLDGHANPPSRNVTTVTFRTGDGTVRGDHALVPDYEYGARLVDSSRNRSVRDFADSAAGFLAEGTAVAHTYLIRRRR
jgi:hypothetical protein